MLQELSMVAHSVYFIGIGGSGMLPLARLARARGYQVFGSDAKLSSPDIEALKDEGIQAYGPPDPERIQQEFVVYSSAISQIHPERADVAAKSPGRLLHRMEFLNRLVAHCPDRFGIAGTHGKTSSTALAGWLLEQLGCDPLIIAGGRPMYLQGGIRNGQSIAVFETDESDASFLKSNATVRLILNVDEDHLNHYGSLSALQSAFQEFGAKGRVIVNRNDSFLAGWRNQDAGLTDLHYYEVCEDRQKCDASDALVAGYFPDSDDRMVFRMRNGQQLSDYNEFRLPVPGRHFASNALGVVGALNLFVHDLDLVALVRALNSFPGTERRLQQIGAYRGAPVFDDYGHHPSEISAVLSALKQRYPEREIRVVFQPHRYTRTKELAGAFARTLGQSDHAYVLPIYTAGEEAIEGIDENSILALMDPEKASAIADLEEPFRRPGAAVVLFLGAGSVSAMARDFLKERDAFQDTIRT